MYEVVISGNRIMPQCRFPIFNQPNNNYVKINLFDKSKLKTNGLIC